MSKEKIPQFLEGQTMFGHKSPSNAREAEIFVGQEFTTSDFINNTRIETDMRLVRVTAAAGLLPNRPWTLDADGKYATDYADTAAEYSAGIPESKLDGTLTVPLNDIVAIVIRGFAKCRAKTGGDATGFTPGTMVTHDTGGLASGTGLISTATWSKAVIGESRSTLAATTNGDVTIFVNKQIG